VYHFVYIRPKYGTIINISTAIIMLDIRYINFINC